MAGGMSRPYRDNSPVFSANYLINAAETPSIPVASEFTSRAALAIWFGAEKVAGLPMDSPIKLFLTAVPAVAALFGLLWGLVLVIRGEKRTLWG